MKQLWQDNGQPDTGRFVWVRVSHAGQVETSPVLHVTRRTFLPAKQSKEEVVLFYPLDGAGHIGEKPNHAVQAWQYAEPARDDVQVLITRCKVLQRLLDDAHATIKAQEAKLRSAGVQL